MESNNSKIHVSLFSYQPRTCVFLRRVQILDRKKNSKKEILVFLSSTFALSIPFWILLARHGFHAGTFPLALGLMFCPGVSAVIVRLFFRRNLRGLGWRWGKTRYQVLSCFLPLGYCFAVYGIVWVSGLGAFNAAVLPGTAEQMLPTLFVGLGLLAASIVSAFGEELGWRGHLASNLASHFGYTKISLITGGIWVLWHLPLVLFTNYRSFAGSESEGTAPLFPALLFFIVMIMGMSFVYTWLRLKSGSVWTAVFLHAVHNLLLMQVFAPLTINGAWTPLVAGEFGNGLSIVAILAALFFWAQRWRLLVGPNRFSGGNDRLSPLKR